MAIVEACEGKHGTITKLEKKEQREKAPMLYDLTTLQREANTRYGFSARRTLAAAQRLLRGAQGAHLPAYQLALPDHRHGRGDQAHGRAGGRTPRVRKAAAYVTGLDLLPLGRVVERREGDRPPRDHPDQVRARPRPHGLDDKRIYDMVARRFLAVFHPEAVFENTRVETTIPAGEDERDGGYVFRTRGKLLLVPGWRGVYDEISAAAPRRPPARARRGGRGRRPAAAEARTRTRA